MNYGKFSESTNQYELTDGYALERAANREFATHYVVYRNADVDLLLSYEAQCAQLEGLKNLFWITNDGKRIGGVIIRPNYMEGLFLKPPYTDVQAALRVLKPILLSWSDKTKDILTSEILPAELDAYHRAGFRTMESLRYMIRPTEAFDVSWGSNLRVLSPAKEHEQEIAVLLHESFAGTTARQATVEGHRAKLSRHFERNADAPMAQEASSLVYSGEHAGPVAACLVSVGGTPRVSRLAVAPSHRRRGLATRMLKRALTVLHGQYSWLKVNAHIGDPAEGVYFNLGFQPGVEQTAVYIPAGTF